jgi:hypothetical protein
MAGAALGNDTFVAYAGATETSMVSGRRTSLVYVAIATGP